VVTEERRMRYDNIPANHYWERLNALFFIAHPFRLPTIGWMSDIHAYTREKLQAYIAKFYTPDNALLVLVGKIDPKQARNQIQRYFGPIKRAAVPKQEIVTREPEPIGQTRFTGYDQAQPRFDMLFHTPGYPNDSLYALDIIETMLSGRSGRLYRRLVIQEKICTGAGAENEIRLHNGLFHVWATFKEGTDVSKVERMINEELTRISKEVPEHFEMVRSQNTIRMDFINDCQNLESLSDRLAWFFRLGNYQDLLTYPGKIAAIKPDFVKASGLRYLNPQNATIGQMLMKSTAADSAK